jgi:hypothetical protein
MSSEWPHAALPLTEPGPEPPLRTGLNRPASAAAVRGQCAVCPLQLNAWPGTSIPGTMRTPYAEAWRSTVAISPWV